MQWMDEIEQKEDDPFMYRISDEKSPLDKMEMEYYTKIDELLFELNPEEISLSLSELRAIHLGTVPQE